MSDVYSLGCTLYYAVTGKVPFPGGNTPDKIRRHLDETPLNPLHFNPDLPPGFCDAIAAMMDKNPDTRTPTAAAVVELLRPWCDENATKHLAEDESTGLGHFLPRWRTGAAGIGRARRNGFVCARRFGFSAGTSGKPEPDFARHGFGGERDGRYAGRRAGAAAIGAGRANCAACR